MTNRRGGSQGHVTNRRGGNQGHMTHSRGEYLSEGHMILQSYLKRELIEL